MTDPGTYQYRVRAATRNGEFTPWAEVAAFTVSSADIGLDGDVDDDDQPGDADDDDQPGEGEEEVEPFFYGWGFQCDSLSDETEPLIGSFFRETEPTGETYIFCRIDGTLSVLYAVMEIAEAATEETIVSDFVTLFGEVSYDATELTLTWNRQESFTAIIGNGDLTFLNLQKLEVPAPTIYAYSVDEEKLVLNGVPFLRLDTSVQYSFESIPYAWNTAADPGSGTALFESGVNNDHAEIPLPFDVHFNGEPASSLKIATSGLISIKDDEGYELDLGIVLLFSDLVTGRIAYATTGSAPDRIFVITYYDMHDFEEPEASSTFQIEFREGHDDFTIRYQTVDEYHLDAVAGIFESFLVKLPLASESAYRIYPVEE